MKPRRLMFAAVLILSFLAFAPGAATFTASQAPAAAATAAKAAPPEYGPANGTLVIVGGGSTDGTTIMEKFVELGGGVDGKFVIVPTAGGKVVKYADGTTPGRRGGGGGGGTVLAVSSR